MSHRISHRECYGCGKCTIVCPYQAIKMISDEEGFLYPKIEDAICMKCGLCKNACIANMAHSLPKRTTYTYAGVSKNKDILEQSTSGGAGTLLAEHILKSGGIVYGVALKGLEVEHIRIDHIQELFCIQGSKYVQSDLSTVLDSLLKDVKNNELILFTGTPCQIYAVKTLIGDYDKLYCVELVCMGCPSSLVWEKHLETYENKNGKIEQVKFRDKITGWWTSCLSYVIDGEKKYTMPHMDAFMAGFAQGLFFRPSCHVCKFKGETTAGDIKIGDFWGIGNDENPFDLSKGVSLLIIESEKGKELFSAIRPQMDCKEMDYRFALSYNPHVRISKAPSKNRQAFFDGLKQGTYDFDELVRNHLISPVGEKERFWRNYPVVERLLDVKVQGKSFLHYFEINNYNKVILYGMGKISQIFAEILIQDGVQVQCIVDRNYKHFSKQCGSIPVIGPHEIYVFEYDCIIISQMHVYDSIVESLRVQEVGAEKVLSIEDIVLGM